MKFKTAYTTKTAVHEAVEDLKKQCQDFEAKLILFFASSSLDTGISRTMQDAFGSCKVVGCTTSGEIVSGKMLDNGIVMMAFGQEVFDDIAIEILENISGDNHVVDQAFDNFARHTKTPMDRLDSSKYVGVVLIDGLSGCEEKINERIGDLTNITFIGGSSGDDLKFEKTYIYANGAVYENAAVLILLKPTVSFDILKTQSFSDTGKVLTVTANDESKREISRLNNQPATAAYAEALGVTKEDLSGSMFKNPLGLMLADDEPFVRSSRVVEGDNILFYCNVKKGMELHLLNSTDIVKDTQKALDQKKKEMGDIGAIINFNCILRTLDLKQQNRTQEYADLFADLPTVGFSTYGESYIGHINQTATMLLFKDQ